MLDVRKVKNFEDSIWSGIVWYGHGCPFENNSFSGKILESLEVDINHQTLIGYNFDSYVLC